MCVTVNECTEQQAADCASTDGMWREHAHAPVFLSHYGDPQDPTSGDIQAHQRIAEQPQSLHPATLLPILHADQSITCTGRRRSPDQPLPPGGVLRRGGNSRARPRAGRLHVDARGGALRQYGLGEFTPPLGMLAGGVPELMVAAALQARGGGIGRVPNCWRCCAPSVPTCSHRFWLGEM